MTEATITSKTDPRSTGCATQTSGARRALTVVHYQGVLLRADPGSHSVLIDRIDYLVRSNAVEMHELTFIKTGHRSRTDMRMRLHVDPAIGYAALIAQNG